MLRILSDLHIRDAASKIRRLADLEPLLDGVDELWLNGDTCDNQTGLAPADLDEIRAFFIARVPVVRFLTGNHDPDISTVHEASAAEGRLWATHGDVFLDSVVPWSRVRDKIEERVARALQADSALDLTTFEGRIAAMRQACLGFGRECDPERNDPAHRLRRLFTEFFPPRQPLAMLHTWWTFPHRAVTQTRRWRPDARVIVTGHVHFPRVWQRGDYTVINTGAFTGPLGARCVDVFDGHLAVRTITWRRRAWHAGDRVATIALAT
ncbi:metallophosphoesterase [Actomonas aquatica]|uniref:Metallophosphoesterase family protein n=1 Tax=Actomonas aquatica TaxID=2866162 RepID=A0ABZ1CBC6_9BACT|nr:metallophosphoesterase [Opitutus sp. WL0086]WRQ88803.1 metallophosphoesterase family protein [Opitutus sp. WL0086]